MGSIMNYLLKHYFKLVRRSIWALTLLSLIIVPLVAQSKGATMTVYKDGTALLKQPVNWPIKTGINRVTFDILPKGMVDDSPFLTVDGVRIGYQRLNRNIFTWEKYFADRVGEEVELRTNSGEEEEGILFSFTPQQIVLQQKNTIKLFNRKEIEWFAVTGLVPDQQLKPYLSWDVYSRSDKSADGELIYLSRGFTWSAIYRLVLDADTTQAELVTEARIVNSSNIDFTNLELQLVEGNLRRVRPGYDYSKRGGQNLALESMATRTVPPTHETLGDYHIYYLPEKIDFIGNESVTVRLYNPSRINFVKTYLFQNSERSQRDEPLSVQYKFINSEENQLNKPLPRGKVEIYQTTSRGSIEFAGEDNIGQVPRGEEVTLEAGRAFDVIGKRKVLNYDRQRKSEQATIEIFVSNKRDEDISVRLIENISGDWVIRDESSMYIKESASTIYFPLTIPAGESIRVTYTYRKAWN